MEKHQVLTVHLTLAFSDESKYSRSCFTAATLHSRSSSRPALRTNLDRRESSVKALLSACVRQEKQL